MTITLQVTFLNTKALFETLNCDMEYGLYFLEVVVQGPIIILNCFECS